ncbi:Recombination protein MgsA [Desulfonispora thiosulfatigenes DSM 11270]|uniref:Replication-associated recombination protein A n=1 Tax=Desulfonispora thiosulfatigenes DSM 11270 TaxID=656914 RepID=A0A1W1VQU8_DESTI|nr:replication-associated recombination protein A [Desulfonispora thiosulfatigenes]SMB95643.1 Recombination protein MgsA [Desulfonispora thiosulfatigenes DSM 11270]
MDLFSMAKEGHLKKKAPLASRMRPKTLDDILGQDEILGKGKLLRNAIEEDNVNSLIFYGPPGTGKTTIANVIAEETNSYFIKLNAVINGVADLRRIIAEAEENLSLYQKSTIIFIDEIHRFNKSQQDALLPSVEAGIVKLIGATTENPFFSINSALLSRLLIFRLNSLSIENIIDIIKKSITDTKQGLGNYNISITEDAIDYLAKSARGDVRIALNSLEMVVGSIKANEKGVRVISVKNLKEIISNPIVAYDKTGDNHYDIISAFIKSMRGSDPDATLHYLARMLEAGEDPRFIARRIVIHASEDVGLADPNALVVAQSAASALEFIGLPEGRIILAQAALYIALAPKSNAVITGIDSALNDIRNIEIGTVPTHLRDAHYQGAQKLGHGLEYKYPHNYPNGFVEQQYLPDALKEKKYYNSTKKKQINNT